MFDPETLRTFIAVAETGSFSKAAERLCKTTATISYRIKLLEENTGVALFFRTTRSVTLTAAGEHLLSQARDWLSWLESMPSELQQVNIVINNLLYNPQAVAQLLAWLNERYPFTQFHISRQIYMGVWDSILYEGFSLAIGVTGTEALANTFSLDPLGSVQWRFVMAADHPLANVEEPLTEAQLRRFPAVNIEDSARTLTKRVAWRLPGQKEIIVPDMETKIAAHLAGVGIGFLPKSLCQSMIDNQQLVSRVIPTMRPPSPLSLAWRKFGSGKAVEDIVTLFTQRRPEISGFLEIFGNPRS
ncbi:HTH-type transcriptional activator AllS [Shigella dysenteriae]|uniref:HTH-type transcriptional activator AllS n=1 Tax=Shigella dysenteriae TaxID=622 RepID=A0A2S8DFE4_SHIDY|nr:MULTISPECIES: HTH-type transcriptional activator AllS [Shigella]EFV9746461.1 HTH-type transcriptional activator AllS [Shigella flexneri]EFY9109528.1 HTH-type transcriptional activator AllS [Shigella sonnei]EJY6562918.1 HTH-type transcriptional activator AllS [Escherichia coli]EFP5952824.1 HTH-type transcriptional activator AllS [Shigella dysenteriae]EFP7662472.1 HTH-type transcriptional activator AllS [Shigella dysenteriae]